jgi:hypothetical protein
MEQISEYIIVYGPKDHVEQEVTNRLKDDYYPFGSPFQDANTRGLTVCQAMVKYRTQPN